MAQGVAAGATHFPKVVFPKFRKPLSVQCHSIQSKYIYEQNEFIEVGSGLYNYMYIYLSIYSVCTVSKGRHRERERERERGHERQTKIFPIYKTRANVQLSWCATYPFHWSVKYVGSDFSEQICSSPRQLKMVSKSWQAEGT